MSARAYHLKRKFGITEEQYNELLERQGGGCAICGKTGEQEGKSLAVDHNHVTGEIRGVLCYRCNHFLIGRHTDADILQRMADYLRVGTGWYVPPKPKKKPRKPRKPRAPRAPRKAKND